MTVVRDSTFIGQLVMDAIDARPNRWSISLHAVPRDERDAIVARAVDQGWIAREINDDGIAVYPPGPGGYAHVNLWPERSS